ncbi:MAG: response regulator [Candidatus Nitrosomaritimum yanchengensis]
MKILVVDDNKSITSSLEKYLKIKGYDVTISNDGNNGFELINKEKWDTILLDLSMPEYSGLNIIEDLEKNNQLKDKNIILFTASSVPDYVLNKLLTKEGIKMCLRKPISLSKIVETIAA